MIERVTSRVSRRVTYFAEWRDCNCDFCSSNATIIVVVVEVVEVVALRVELRQAEEGKQAIFRLVGSPMVPLATLRLFTRESPRRKSRQRAKRLLQSLVKLILCKLEIQYLESSNQRLKHSQWQKHTFCWIKQNFWLNLLNIPSTNRFWLKHPRYFFWIKEILWPYSNARVCLFKKILFESK